MKKEENRNNDYDDLNTLQREEKRPAENGVKRGFFFSGVIVGLAGSLLIISLMYLATRLQQIIEIRRNPEIAAGVEITPSESSFLDEEAVSKIQIIEDTIKDYFYLAEVTDEELEEGVYRGMLEALEDPYSEYYSAEELAEIMGSSHQNVKQILLKLEKKGFVEICADSEDKRKQRISLTDYCMEFCKKNDEVSSGIVKKMFDGISEEQLRITIQTITQIEGNLKDDKK